ncbi:MAG: hypothetical protein K2G86_09490, partial [Prevotella sp.]|nr:hypothetical protein [Prevotella sp.]
VADPGGPPWSATTEKQETDGGKMSRFQPCRSPELKFSSVKFRDIIATVRKQHETQPTLKTQPSQRDEARYTFFLVTALQCQR